MEKKSFSPIDSRCPKYFLWFCNYLFSLSKGLISDHRFCLLYLLYFKSKTQIHTVEFYISINRFIILFFRSAVENSRLQQARQRWQLKLPFLMCIVLHHNFSSTSGKIELAVLLFFRRDGPTT